MLVTKVSPALAQNAIKPVGTNILRRLRVPVLTGVLALGSIFAAKAQSNDLKKDCYEPEITVVNDTIKNNTPAPKVVTNDTIQGNTPTIDTIVNNKYNLNDNTTFEFNVIGVDSLSLNNSGCAAEELYTKILANIENGGDNPYSAIYSALSKQRNNTNDKVSSLMGLDHQIDETIESIKLYKNDQKDEINEQMKEDGSITEFHYGNNNSKKGILIQTLNISGINQKNKNDNDSQNDTISNNDTNDFMGDVAYRIKAVTEKAEVETNIHAGSQDLDIQLAATYKTKTDDGGNISLSLNGRETMINSKTHGSAGAAIDYNKKNLSTGLYYYYNREVDESGMTDKNSQLEGYLKYKQNVNLTAGLEYYDFLKYYYTNLKLSGSKKLEQSNLKLSGALSTELGSFSIAPNDVGINSSNYTNLEVGANGGIYFKTDDINASLNGMVSYKYLIDRADSNNHLGGLNLSLLGAFSTDKISISAMLAAYKCKDFITTSNITTPNDVVNVIPTNDIGLAAGVCFEIKDLLKGISPQFSYTATSFNNNVEHFINATVKTSIESMRKK